MTPDVRLAEHAARNMLNATTASFLTAILRKSHVVLIRESASSILLLYILLIMT